MRFHRVALLVAALGVVGCEREPLPASADAGAPDLVGAGPCGIPPFECCEGVSCFELFVCVHGVCECRPNHTVCFGTCVDLSTDVLDCGACGNKCFTKGIGFGLCTDGKC